MAFEIEKCPSCGTNDWHKNGKDKGVQRVKCKECGYPTYLLMSGKLKRKPVVSGVTAKDKVQKDFVRDVLPELKKIGKAAKAANKAEDNQTITMPEGPFAIAMMSDVHGGAKADYEAIERDVNAVRDTEDMYAILAGDLTDNFIIGKLNAIQKDQHTVFSDEVLFIQWFISNLRDSLIAFVSGNHDNWTKKLTARDHLKELLGDAPALFDNHQVRFSLKQNGEVEKWLVRHKFKYSSVFNATHGMQVTWDRGEKPFDVVLGGHTHIASLCNEFLKHDKKRYAVLLGTYKLRDEFGLEHGFPKTHSATAGSGVFVYDGYGDKYWCDTIQKGQKLLEYFKSSYHKKFE